MPAVALAALLVLASSGSLAGSPARGAAPRPSTPQTAAPQTTAAKARRAESPRELAGLMLGQFAKDVEAKLGKPDHSETDEDGESLWSYELAPDAATVLTVSLSDDDDKTVTAIMISGKPKEGAGDLHGVKLGMTKAQAVERLGEPDTTEPREESDTETAGEGMDWEDRNYYVEVNDDGEVDWIEIDDTPKGYPEVGDRRPELAGLAKALQSRDREEILGWLCADVEIDTKADGRVGYGGGPRERLFDESSLIARYVYGGEGSMRDAISAELARTAPQTRKTDEGVTYWAHVFPAGAPIAEIVWWFEAGRWRVWHVRMAPAS